MSFTACLTVRESYVQQNDVGCHEGRRELPITIHLTITGLSLEAIAPTIRRAVRTAVSCFSSGQMIVLDKDASPSERR